MILPMRFRILHLMSEKKSLNEDEVMAALKPEYGSEGQYKKSIIELHLQSMRAVGLIDVCDVSLKDNGELLETYKITEYGRGRLSYLPQGWKS